MIDVDDVIGILEQNKKSIKNINLKKWDLINKIIEIESEEK